MDHLSIFLKNKHIKKFYLLEFALEFLLDPNKLLGPLPFLILLWTGESVLSAEVCLDLLPNNPIWLIPSTTSLPFMISQNFLSRFVYVYRWLRFFQTEADGLGQILTSTWSRHKACLLSCLLLNRRRHAGQCRWCWRNLFFMGCLNELWSLNLAGRKAEVLSLKNSKIIFSAFSWNI